MATSGSQAYAWAKACGILGKCYLKPRTSQLLSITRLAELDRALFPENPLALPEKELLVRLQQRVAERAAARVMQVVSSFDVVHPALACLPSSYEYLDMARVLAALVVNGDCPQPTEIGAFRTVAFNHYPDLVKMTAGTAFAWLGQRLVTTDTLSQLEAELDHQYYTGFWQAIQTLPAADKPVFTSLVAEEIALKNIVWALRFKTYFGMSQAEILPHLLDLPWQGSSLNADAVQVLSFSLTERSDWKNWKRQYLLNEEKPGEAWKLNPRKVQNAAAQRLYARAKKLFRMNPSSLGSIACFARLVAYEEDFLTSLAEGLVLGLSPHEVVAALEVIS